MWSSPPKVFNSDTIAAVATPSGAGGLGVVRLSGPGAWAVARQVFRGGDWEQAPSHTLHHGWLVDGETTLDEVVAALFRAPRSYTGEDVVEFSCHGGPQVMARALETCLRAGARMADPGEFTRRAFLNGKMDLSQAEAVAELSAARSESQRRLALASLRGHTAQSLKPLREKLLGLLAHVEAHLDFVDDEIPLLTRDTLGAELNDLVRDLDRLLENSSHGRLWREGLKVVLVGRPNVGKSSLFNRLLRTDRAIVTNIPGTTRDVLEETLAWNGVAVALSDTAGLRGSIDPVEREGHLRARRAIDEADVVLLIIDATELGHREDQTAAQAVRHKKVVLAVNKCDLSIDPAAAAALGKTQAMAWFDPIPPVVALSAKTGVGADDLRRAVLALATAGAEPEESAVVFNSRQKQLLERARAAVDAARQSVGRRDHEETLSIDLKSALALLNQVTGLGTPEEVLDAIFTRFCVGK